MRWCSFGILTWNIANKSNIAGHAIVMFRIKGKVVLLYATKQYET